MDDYMKDDKTINLTQQEYINLMAHKITHDVVTETRVDIDRLNDNISKRFEQVDKRFEQVDKRIEQVDKRIEQVDKRIDRVQTFLYWIVGLGLTSIVLPIVYPLIKANF
jgi:tetrahydromethanopterin S-methyltransferase subunit G